MDFKSKQMKRAMFLIAFALVLMWLLENISGVWQVVGRGFSIISPFILGAAMAFILNSPMMFIERVFFGEKSLLRKTKDKFKRPISYLVTLILFTASILIILLIIIPELVNTVQDLAIKVPGYWDKLQVYVEKNMMDNPQVVKWVQSIAIDWASIEQNIVLFFKRSALDWIGTTFSFASSVIGALVTFTLAFIFSIYVLLQKDRLISQLKSIVIAYLSENVANRIFYIANLSNNVFSHFLSGQLLEALIIGGLFLVAMTIFGFPYALMISLLISVTALIPMIGAFIGCAVGAFLILVDNPTKALWFLIMFLVIQQIEGNLIYPHVVGKAAGLPSIWILVAVTVGASLMGVLGILLFIPISSILYTLLRESVQYRLKQKNIQKL